jgi:hypothetical protein
MSCTPRAGSGVVLLTGGRTLVGGAVIWLGAAVIAIAMAVLIGLHVLGYVAVMTSGVAAIATGAAWHTEQPVLIVAMTIATGVAITGFGMAEIGPAVVASGFRRLVDSLSKAPRAHDGLTDCAPLERAGAGPVGDRPHRRWPVVRGPDDLREVRLPSPHPGKAKVRQPEVVIQLRRPGPAHPGISPPLPGAAQVRLDSVVRRCLRSNRRSPAHPRTNGSYFSMRVAVCQDS